MSDESSENGTHPAPCCNAREADRGLLLFEWDDGSRWGTEGWYLRPHDYRRPLSLVMFCPFCGKRFERRP